MTHIIFELLIQKLCDGRCGHICQQSVEFPGLGELLAVLLQKKRSRRWPPSLECLFRLLGDLLTPLPPKNPEEHSESPGNLQGIEELKGIRCVGPRPGQCGVQGRQHSARGEATEKVLEPLPCLSPPRPQGDPLPHSGNITGAAEERPTVDVTLQGQGTREDKS